MVTPFFVPDTRNFANAFSIFLDQRTQFGGQFPGYFWEPDFEASLVPVAAPLIPLIDA